MDAYSSLQPATNRALEDVKAEVYPRIEIFMDDARVVLYQWLNDLQIRNSGLLEKIPSLDTFTFSIAEERACQIQELLDEEIPKGYEAMHRDAATEQPGGNELGSNGSPGIRSVGFVDHCGWAVLIMLLRLQVAVGMDCQATGDAMSTDINCSPSNIPTDADKPQEEAFLMDELPLAAPPHVTKLDMDRQVFDCLKGLLKDITYLETIKVRAKHRSCYQSTNLTTDRNWRKTLFQGRASATTSTSSLCRDYS